MGRRRAYCATATASRQGFCGSVGPERDCLVTQTRRVTDHNRHDANVSADFATLKNRRDCLLGTGGTSAHRAAVRPVRSSQETAPPSSVMNSRRSRARYCQPPRSRASQRANCLLICSDGLMYPCKWLIGHFPVLCDFVTLSMTATRSNAPER